MPWQWQVRAGATLSAPEEGRSGAGSGARRWALAVAVAVVLSALSLALPANHDVAWLLYVGGRVLDGARPYRDIIEINPPPAVVLETMVAALARLVHVPALGLHAVLVQACCWTSAALTLRSLRSRFDEGRFRLVAVGILVALIALPGYGTGQRDQLALVCLLPFITALGLGGDAAPALVALAAVGIALRPHLVLVPLAVGLLSPARARRSLLLLGVLLAVLAGAASAAFPAYVPTAVHYGPVYAAFARATWPNLLRRPNTLLCGVLLLAGLALRPQGGQRRLAEVYLVAALAALGAVFIQRKGFSYHYIAAQGFALVAVSVGLAERLAAPGRLVLAAASGAAVLVGALELGEARRTTDEGQPQIRSELEGSLRPYGPGAKVLGLSWTMEGIFPAVNDLRLQWQSPYPNMWVIQGGMPARRPDLTREAVDRILASANPRPHVIVLDTVMSNGVRLSRYLSRDSRFAELLSSYRVARMVGRFQILDPGRATHDHAPPGRAAPRPAR